MAEITIRGAGIFGLSVAWACVKRGAKVRVVDPYGVAAGASGGIVGALAPHVPENWNEKTRFQFESLIMAEPYWREVEKISGLASGYGKLGRVQSINDARGLELAQARITSAAALWGDQAAWSVIKTTGADWEPLSTTGWLIHDTLSARIHPKHACATLAAAIIAKGGEVTREAEDAGQVVWATGVADLAMMSTALAKPVGSSVKGQGALLRYSAPRLPQIFSDAVHIVPHDDGTVAIGSTSERNFESGTETDAQLDDVIEKAMNAVPVLRGAEVLTRWAGVRPRAKSRAPMLGAHPLHKGAFIANGGFKIGFGMAPMVGEVMADLVLEGRDVIPSGFRPEASLG